MANSLLSVPGNEVIRDAGVSGSSLFMGAVEVKFGLMGGFAPEWLWINMCLRRDFCKPSICCFDEGLQRGESSHPFREQETDSSLQTD